MKEKKLVVYQNLQFKPAVFETVVKEQYEMQLQEALSFYEPFVGPGDLVFDVGAYKGQFAHSFLALGAKVVCFEPLPLGAKTIKRKLPKAVVEPIGLQAWEGKRWLALCETDAAQSTLSHEPLKAGRYADRHYKWTKKIEVDGSTLERMIEKYGTPRHCRIDVTCSEKDVLFGLMRPLDSISIRFNGDELEATRVCLRRLFDLGYRQFNCTVGQRGLYLIARWVDYYEMLHRMRIIMGTHDFWPVWGLWGHIFAKI